MPTNVNTNQRFSRLTRLQMLLIGAATLIAGRLIIDQLVTAGKIREIEDRVKDTLADPESARFRSIFLRHSRAENVASIVCVKVNAKNKFGGYAGYQEYYGVYETNDGAPALFSHEELNRTWALKNTFLRMKEEFKNDPKMEHFFLRELEFESIDQMFERSDWAEKVIMDCSLEFAMND